MKQRIYKTIWIMALSNAYNSSHCIETLVALARGLEQIGAPQDISQELEQALETFQNNKAITLSTASAEPEYTSDYGKLLLQAFAPVTSLQGENAVSIQTVFGSESRYNEKSKNLGTKLLQEVRTLNRELSKIEQERRREREKLEEAASKARALAGLARAIEELQTLDITSDAAKKADYMQSKDNLIKNFFNTIGTHNNTDDFVLAVYQKFSGYDIATQEKAKEFLALIGKRWKEIAATPQKR